MHNLLSNVFEATKKLWISSLPTQDLHEPSSSLKKLRQAYQERQSNWVFAGDLSELEFQLDRIRARYPQEKIRLEIDSDWNDFFWEKIEEGAHLTRSDTCIGPAYVDKLTLTVHDQEFPVSYHYIVTDSFFKIFDPVTQELVSQYNCTGKRCPDSPVLMEFIDHRVGLPCQAAEKPSASA